MEQQLDIPKLLVLRRLTTAISKYFESQLRSHLTVLTPLFHPRTLFGELVRGVTKHPLKTAEKSFQELKGMYQALIRRQPYHELGEINAPLDVFGTSVELSAAEYTHVAKADGVEKTIKVSSPLKWILAYKGTGPDHLRTLIAKKDNSTQLQPSVLHYLVLHMILSKSQGMASLFEALRFPVSTGRTRDLGELPVTFISCPIATIRPSDEVVVQSTELSGKPAFEEVVDLKGIATLSDPIKGKLLELVRSTDNALLTEIQP